MEKLHGECYSKLKECHSCRAVLVQLGFYFHMKQSLGYSRLVLTRPLVFTMCFMLFFSIVIALFKDIPDVRGDRQVSFHTHLSRHNCFFLKPKPLLATRKAHGNKLCKSKKPKTLEEFAKYLQL